MSNLLDNLDRINRIALSDERKEKILSDIIASKRGLLLALVPSAGLLSLAFLFVFIGQTNLIESYLENNTAKKLDQISVLMMDDEQELDRLEQEIEVIQNPAPTNIAHGKISDSAAGFDALLAKVESRLGSLRSIISSRRIDAVRKEEIRLLVERCGTSVDEAEEVKDRDISSAIGELRHCFALLQNT